MVAVPALLLFAPLPAAAPIHEAARAGDLERLRALLDRQPDLVRARDEQGRTALHWAARGVHLPVLAFLLERGADPNAVDAGMATALHSVASRNHAAAVRLLCRHGAKVDTLAYNRQGALHLAAEAGAAEAVEALIGSGARLDPKNQQGRTPLVLGARQSGDPRVTRLLLQAGARLDILDDGGSSALELAAWRGFKDCVDVLLDHRAHLSVQGAKAGTLLVYGAQRALVRLFRAMTAQGAGLEAATDEGGSLLHAAAIGGSVEIVEELLRRGLPAEGRDAFGWAPAHYAARDGRGDVLKVLLRRGASPDTRNLMGQSALNVADENGRADIRAILLDAKADPGPMAFPVLKGDYLGQKPPGRTPELFAPGIVSSPWRLHGCPVFSPDGGEVAWACLVLKPGEAYSSSKVDIMRREQGRWLPPKPAPFLEAGNGDVPFYSPDGRRLHVLSRRPTPDGAATAERIWYAERTSTGWSEAHPFDPVVNARPKHWQFSMDRAGDVYFASSAPGGRGGEDIWVCRLEGGRYTAPENLGDAVNTDRGEGTPFISPDGRYLLFNRDQELCVSFRQADGTWGRSVPLGPDFKGLCPNVTPDGKYLFFLGTRGLFGAWWADAAILRELAPGGR